MGKVRPFATPVRVGIRSFARVRCGEDLSAGGGLVRERGSGQFELVRGQGSDGALRRGDEVLAHRLARVERLERDDKPVDGQVLGNVVERRMVLGKEVRSVLELADRVAQLPRCL